MGGVRSAAVAYGRPSVVVNEASHGQSGYCVWPDDVYLSKHVYSKSLKRFLSLQEQLYRIDQLQPDRKLWEKEYVAVENTAEEILTVVEEFYASKFGDGFDWNIQLQSKYWALRNHRVRQAFYDEKTDCWRSITIEQTAELEPYISKALLEKCWDVSEYLDQLTEYYNRTGSLEGFDERQR